MQDRQQILHSAVQQLCAGGLVAFPTETVYGLGADATNDRAVAAIYETKGRPTFNPLITHVPDKAAAFAYATFDPLAERLMDAFWPGPLTLILPRREACKLSLLVSAGLDCIGLRAPAHPMAQALLKEAGIPIAAPSANRSGKISPTTAAHVAEELGDACMILDGGACHVGIESTVLDLTGEYPAILRHGSVTQEMIAALCHPALVAGAGDGVFKSPGMLESHYAPNAQLRLNATHAEPDELLLAFGTAEGALNLSVESDLSEAAANLFAMLRALDKKASRIAVSPIPMQGLGIAINDRLMRAAVR